MGYPDGVVSPFVLVEAPEEERVVLFLGAKRVGIDLHGVVKAEDE
jgi:hypothetical protein